MAKQASEGVFVAWLAACRAYPVMSMKHSQTRVQGTSPRGTLRLLADFN
jgi:hypothetical protein